MFSPIETALAALRRGEIIIVVDDEDRENEGDFVALAEYATPEVINFMITHGRGLVCIPIEMSHAKALHLHPMVEKNSDLHGTAFTISVDHVSTTTGISAFERAQTVQALLTDGSKPEDFRRPGHLFPLVAKEGGVLRRAGHTEAAVDLAQLCGAKPAGVICEVLKQDGTMARVPDLLQLANEFSLHMITIADLIAYRKRVEKLVTREAEALLPTTYGDFKIYVYANALDQKEHVALVMGDVTPTHPTLVRVHSECLTGDVFGSHRCDCGPQLHAALETIAQEGSGVLLYMRQEGRGIGLINKIRAYELQEQGFDTVEANQKLGFAPDLRDYGIGAQILEDLGVREMRLLTNNPRKISGLSGYGLSVVERVPIQMDASQHNAQYLATKKSKLGHLLNM
ncbi:bifunctional 3,4-dihydroxy-2-butanone-4-phosphate synthase/GTP cyclohydrolase II [Ferroacidibacillus organovorans]|uniref:Riboflavin biosynthesis protein RibBA n=1 Tax=Ferroacidibacillus organovorans TaxID=1765683 RepID=A0A1V4EUJ9_9BACL|nr:bifunctional 3,4-dihydroxy-2-butanone-4-phosphate synthase/GTP cyclohydrolase II [Ferroacidibacillus organovorans]OAG94673.1 3,4-dihydroxy-2-butanone 4-phosphate synthase [Ferroacidibacillus organovorans]OPG16613.1 bifunctional 3,4-dihydroxy-2-butanone-4-phosphate synthase/GTP cyclohydrolase II [Ferroacidibacillus organovorans]